jgi:5-methylcytosine-specific restriction endonuclease McrA
MVGQGRHRTAGAARRQRERVAAGGTATDPRYKDRRWRVVRLRVLARDRSHCYVLECANRANVVDHIKPVYLGMPDSEFFGMWNLRASCRRHNTARGVAARLERETAQGVAELPKRISYGPRANGASD